MTNNCLVNFDRDDITNKESKGLIYLASPYTSESSGMMEFRFNEVCRVVAALMRSGIHIFSPIAHTHPIAQYGLPKDWVFWKKHNEIILGFSVALWVLKLPGWDKSIGVKEEIVIAEKRSLIIRYLDWKKSKFNDS